MNVTKNYDMESERGLKTFIIHNLVMHRAQEVLAFAKSESNSEATIAAAMFKLLSLAMGAKLKAMIGEEKAKRFMEEKEKLLSVENLMSGIEETPATSQAESKADRFTDFGLN